MVMENLSWIQLHRCFLSYLSFKTQGTNPLWSGLVRVICYLSQWSRDSGEPIRLSRRLHQDDTPDTWFQVRTCLLSLLLRRIFCVLASIRDDRAYCRICHFTQLPHFVCRWANLAQQEIVLHFPFCHRGGFEKMNQMFSEGSHMTSFFSQNYLLSSRFSVKSTICLRD